MALGTKMLIVIFIINIGLVALAPQTFYEDNEFLTRTITSFGIELNNTYVIEDGQNVTAIIPYVSDNETAVDDLGLGSNTTSGILSEATSFFSPLLYIIDFVRAIFAFAFAPLTIMSKAGAPVLLRLMIGAPIAVLYILAIASWIRGVEF